MLKWMIVLGAIAALGLLSLDAMATTEAKPLAGATGFTISGKVVNAGGASVGTGVEVRLVRLEKGDKRDKGATTRPAKREVVATATTDANGDFTFSDVKSGRFGVAAREKGTGHGHSLVLVDHASVSGLVITLEKGSQGKKST